MRKHTPKMQTLLRWFAGMHSIHAVLIAVASLGAVLPSARLLVAPPVVHVDASQQNAGDPDEDDRDRSQNQDRDTDQDQDRDVSDATKIFVSSESEQDDFLAPELVLVMRRGPQATVRRGAVLASNSAAPAQVERKAPLAVYSRTCRLML